MRRLLLAVEFSLILDGGAKETNREAGGDHEPRRAVAGPAVALAEAVGRRGATLSDRAVPGLPRAARRAGAQVGGPRTHRGVGGPVPGGHAPDAGAGRIGPHAAAAGAVAGPARRRPGRLRDPQAARPGRHGRRLPGAAGETEPTRR